MKSKGFTLIELAVVLAIIAVLAAVLTPMVTGYLDQARLARAQGDVRTIADSIRLYQRDTGRWPVFSNAAGYTGNSSASVEIATSTGNSPTAGSGWLVTGASLGNSALESYMNNDYTVVGSAAFPKAGFRGPYVKTVDSDPWGNKYVLNANDLTGTTNHAYVISAGPNGTLETTRDVAVGSSLTAGGDDIISAIK
jgi:prepilin-type N-terminal cleavage/methylation domain-containing protein